LNRSRARYGSGLTPQQDVIKAQTELTSLRTDLIMLVLNGAKPPRA